MGLSREQEQRALEALERMAKSFEILAERVPEALKLIAERAMPCYHAGESRSYMEGAGCSCPSSCVCYLSGNCPHIKEGG
jgi:hypothetical protein